MKTHRLIYILGGLFALSCAERAELPADLGRNSPAAFNEACSFQHLRWKSFDEVENDLHLGCEALDRDYADYDEYKSYLEPLGIKRIRLQAGWARTERTKGVYDFRWLDHIIDDAVSRGISPWLQVSYGNTVYSGGGNGFSGSLIPWSEEALAGWEAWVKELAQRYKGLVTEWEIWNEPELAISGGSTMEQLVQLHLRAAEAIKSVDPSSEIAALAMSELNAGFLEEFLARVSEESKLDLFDWISFHGYKYVPESIHDDVAGLKAVLDKYSGSIGLWHGEAGAPSVGYLSGALRNYAWSETSQAKWNLRTIVSDKAHGYRTGVYTIAENNYSETKNTKGLLATDDSDKVIKVKEAYYAIRNLVSVYDYWDRLIAPDDVVVEWDCPHCCYLFEDDGSCLKSLLLWDCSDTPGDNKAPWTVDVTSASSMWESPCAVDLRTGEITLLETTVENGRQKLHDVPFYDSPVMVCECEMVEYKQ